jgi:hypothetical protein
MHFLLFWKGWQVAILQSEVSSISFDVVYHLISNFTEYNSHIFVQEEDMWNIRGRYSQAIKDDEPISWVANSDGKYTLSLLVV